MGNCGTCKWFQVSKELGFPELLCKCKGSPYFNEDMEVDDHCGRYEKRIKHETHADRQ
jgi:hypothetical protein